ncbi:MAG: RDD family protein [Gemmataceae bacterium]
MSRERNRRDDYDDDFDDRDPILVKMPYGNPGLRFAAFLIDNILLAIVSFPIGLMVGIAMVAANGGRPPEPEAQIVMQIGLNLFSIFITWLYFAGMESSSLQATLGKMAVGLRVTDLEGRPIGFLQATGRFFGKLLSSLICCIGYIMILTNDQRQGLHDQLAKTYVLEGKPVASVRARRTRRYEDEDEDDYNDYRNPRRGSEGIRKDRDD